MNDKPRVPKDWGMFTSQGNKSLRLKAEKFVTKVTEEKSLGKQLRDFADFLKSWRRMANAKTMKEALDTAVGDVVYEFVMGVAKQLDIEKKHIDNVWGSNEALP